MAGRLGGPAPAHPLVLCTFSYNLKLWQQIYAVAVATQIVVLVVVHTNPCINIRYYSKFKAQHKLVLRLQKLQLSKSNPHLMSCVVVLYLQGLFN